MRQAPHCPLAAHVNGLPTSERDRQGMERKDEYPLPTVRGRDLHRFIQKGRGGGGTELCSSSASVLNCLLIATLASTVSGM